MSTSYERFTPQKWELYLKNRLRIVSTYAEGREDLYEIKMADGSTDLDAFIDEYFFLTVQSKIYPFIQKNPANVWKQWCD